MNNIVFVEDDPEVGQLIAAYLGKHDLDVTIEPRGDTAMETIVRLNPDLVLLDIMLPGKDGMTLCRDLRPVYKGPIVLLTSLDSDMNHILSLEMGANDYILKTTPPAVLLARLRLHLRQHQTLTSETETLPTNTRNGIHFGQLRIDPVNRQVTLKDKISAYQRQILICCGSWRHTQAPSWIAMLCYSRYVVSATTVWTAVSMWRSHAYGVN